MQIKNINYKLKGKKAVLFANLIMTNGVVHEVFFEVEQRYKNLISKNANAFVPLALAISLKKNEPLEIDGKISKKLLTQIPAVMKILESWNMGYHQVSIKAKGTTQKLAKSKYTGVFFSGGVDSFYTYLKNKKKITHTIFVHGFDIPRSDLKTFKAVEKHIKEVATHEKKKLIVVKTNIREVLDQYFNWDIACEFALASTSLFLSQGFGKIYVSGGEAELNQDYHFMAPELDELWSSEKFNFKHVGHNITKISKIKLLSKSQIAMDNLRVCWLNKEGKYNCGECEKCVRNMLTLYVCDSLKKTKTFPNKIDAKKLSGMRIAEDVTPYFDAILAALIEKKDETEIRFALEKTLKNNKKPSIKTRLINWIRETVRFFDNKYNDNRLFWFLTSKGFI